jgi:soluble lytic murein transglycosylase-like protein
MTVTPAAPAQAAFDSADPFRPGRRSANWVRPLACLLALSALAACSSTRPQMSASKEAAMYAARAKRDYTPPGPPSDPWGPYIIEAAARFDVPEKWVREVMRQESGGRLYENGQLITSNAGAMGLMQVMPVTYDELSGRYGLGDDPFDPHNNILAGTAYLREMYDVYGSPGFLAAYNAGPGRLEDYLLRNKGLPDETRRYVARIGPNIVGYEPSRPSGSTQFAMLQLPVNIPSGPR